LPHYSIKRTRSKSFAISIIFLITKFLIFLLIVVMIQKRNLEMEVTSWQHALHKVWTIILVQKLDSQLVKGLMWKWPIQYSIKSKFNGIQRTGKIWSTKTLHRKRQLKLMERVLKIQSKVKESSVVLQPKLWICRKAPHNIMQFQILQPSQQQLSTSRRPQTLWKESSLMKVGNLVRI
jgi:hypothetical protein